MSEEEKEAIEELRKFSNLIIEGGIPNSIIVNKLKIVFNLIDKLQKELEQEKEKNIELAEELQIAKGGIKIANLDMVDNNYVSKDKIRTKIEELEELFDKNEKEITIQYQNQFIVDVVGVLEELLGDDE